MGFKFQKRINLGKGLGINLSRTGISPSYRGKSGSIGAKGYSIRTGIPGVTYRKSSVKSSKGGCVLLVVFMISITTLAILTKTN